MILFSLKQIAKIINFFTVVHSHTKTESKTKKWIKGLVSHSHGIRHSVHALSLSSSLLGCLVVCYISSYRTGNCRLFRFSPSVMSNSLWPHRLQHARLPCPSSTPGAYSNSCPLSQWYHLTISSSVAPFSSTHTHIFMIEQTTGIQTYRQPMLYARRGG